MVGLLLDLLFAGSLRRAQQLLVIISWLDSIALVLGLGWRAHDGWMVPVNIKRIQTMFWTLYASRSVVGDGNEWQMLEPRILVPIEFVGRGCKAAMRMLWEWPTALVGDLQGVFGHGGLQQAWKCT